MPRTGRQYGLKSNGVVDERSDPEKATRAAAQYLKYLHVLFRDWYLVMAAYNAGRRKDPEGDGPDGFSRLLAARRDLVDPATDADYVPALIAAVLISKNPAHYGFDVVLEKPIEYETVRLDRPVGLRTLAEGHGPRTRTSRRLTPSSVAGHAARSRGLRPEGPAGNARGGARRVCRRADRRAAVLQDAHGAGRARRSRESPSATACRWPRSPRRTRSTRARRSRGARRSWFPQRSRAAQGAEGAELEEGDRRRTADASDGRRATA